MKKPILILVTILAVASLAHSLQLSFEVASIKESSLGVKVEPARTMNPGGIVFTNGTAVDCIAFAYELKSHQVSGADWLASMRYDIAARTAAPATEEQLRKMLQALLADRFKLAFHRGSKEQPIYAITAGRNTSQLKPSAGGPENILRFEGNRLAFRNYSIAALALFMSRIPAVDRRIVDTTSLPGGFDFEVVLDVPDNDPGTVKRAMLEWPSLFSDLERQGIETRTPQGRGRHLRRRSRRKARAQLTPAGRIFLSPRPMPLCIH
jgi:uncharacterized protein (TIGR03435 family)